MSSLSVPSHWEQDALRSVCVKTTTVNPDRNPDAAFEYVDVSSVSNQPYQIVETKTIIGREAPNRARKLIRTDDVLFATARPTLKRVALVPKELDGQVASTEREKRVTEILMKQRRQWESHNSKRLLRGALADEGIGTPLR